MSAAILSVKTLQIIITLHCNLFVLHISIDTILYHKTPLLSRLLHSFSKILRFIFLLICERIKGCKSPPPAILKVLIK